MRVKPEPGTYTITIGTRDYVVVITEQGMTYEYFPFEAEWRWEEIAGGPHLVGANPLGAAIGPVGFTPPDVVVIRTPQGAVSGAYSKNT